MELLIYLTKFCNYKCKYCFKRDQGNSKILSKKLLNLKLNQVNNIIIKNNIKELDITIRGGEYSLINETIPLFHDIINWCNNLKLKINITTHSNYSGKLEYFEKLFKVLDSSKTQITFNFSNHSEYNNILKKAFQEKIIKIKKLSNLINFRLAFDNYSETIFSLTKDSFHKELLSMPIIRTIPNKVFFTSKEFKVLLDDSLNLTINNKIFKLRKENDKNR